MAVQLQWDLQQTSTSVIGVAKGALQAATTDNVQLLAILGCEQLGNIIAMSPDTVRKIERSVVPTPEPAILSFLKSTVGYSKDDCTTYLSTSLAGLRFLGLACALLGTMKVYNAAENVHLLLSSTAKDHTLVPTPRQVRDLLTSIEPRCHCAGFMDEVCGWAALLRPYVMDTTMCAPSIEGIKNLLDAFRQLARIGDNNITMITVKAHPYVVVWVTAFTKWCLGLPPSIILEHGRPVLQPPGAKVTIISVESLPYGTSYVTIHSSIHGPSELVGTDGSSKTELLGMISLRTYGSLLLTHLGSNDAMEKAAVLWVTPFAIRQVLDNLRFGKPPSGESSPAVTWSQDEGTDPGEVRRDMWQLSPFPEDTAIQDAFFLLFGRSMEPNTLDAVGGIADLPLRFFRCVARKPSFDPLISVKQYLCGPPWCEECQVSLRISKIVADVLALSLFQSPELLRVTRGFIGPMFSQYGFLRAVVDVVKSASNKTIGITSLLHYAMQFVGHDKAVLGEEQILQDHRRRFIVSTFGGQTVWPTLYEDFACYNQGFLSLSWLPGRLIHRQEVHSVAFARDELAFFSSNVDPKPPGNQVTRPCNLFPDWCVTWSVGSSELGLEVCLMLAVAKSPSERTGSIPKNAIDNLAAALLVPDCLHDPNAELPADEQAPRAFVKPTYIYYDIDRVSRINVVPIDGSNELRFLSLCSHPHQPQIVLRNRACLACCLTVCKKFPKSILIL